MATDPVMDAWLGTQRLRPGTVRAYTEDLTRFSEWIIGQDVPVHDVDQDDLSRYSLHLDQTGLSASTTHRRRATVRLFYTWLYDQGRIESNPARVYDSVVGPSPVMRDVMSVADLRRLLAAAADPKDRTVVLLLTVMGVPVRELIAIQVTDVLPDGPGWQLRFPSRQGASPLPSLVSGPLLSVQGIRQRGLLLLNARGEAVDRKSVTRIIRRVAGTAKLGYAVNARLLQNSIRAALITNPVPMHALVQGMGG